MGKIEKLKFEFIDHPPYSLDLAPSDFFLFPNLKWLSGQRFLWNKEVITHTNACFEELPKFYFSESLKKLEGGLTKGIELQEDLELKNKKKNYWSIF